MRNPHNIRKSLKILKELYQTGTLLPDTLKDIGVGNGHLLLEELHLILVKSLLNGIDFQTEKSLMKKMIDDEPEFAKIAIKAMFTFDDFAKLPDKTIKKWATHCEDEELIIALKDSNNYLVNKIVSNMNSERAKHIKQQIDNAELVSLDRSYEVMENLINILRKLEMNGEIVIDRFEY